jgi:hypothetical protein
MGGLADQIGDNPVILSLLKMIGAETGNLAPAQPTAEQ